jgi:hypothetical protein
MAQLDVNPATAGQGGFSRSANPLIQGNVGDTIAATRNYVADMANSAALDDQQSPGGVLRLQVVLSALDHLAAQKLHHR